MEAPGILISYSSHQKRTNVSIAILHSELVSDENNVFFLILHSTLRILNSTSLERLWEYGLFQ